MIEYPPAAPQPRPHLPALAIIILIAFGAIAGIVVYRMVAERGTPALEPRPVVPRGDLAADEQSTIELFRNTSPSVVYITTLQQRRNPFNNIVNDVPVGTGSGFLWDNAGHVVTNFHVLRGATAAEITLSDHTTYPARLVGSSSPHDLAVLRIEAPAEKLQPIVVGSSSDLAVGQKVYAIGNPFGYDQTLTTGIVSALGRRIESQANQFIENVIQTDAAINPGNSGGPLLDSAGRLIGINTAIISPSGSSAGIGFAVPVDSVNQVVPQLIRHGYVAMPDLGIVANDPASRRFRRQAGATGLMILAIQPDGPADRAGLRGVRVAGDGSYLLGDIIQSIDGAAITDTQSYLRELQKKEVGQSVQLRIWRDGNTFDVTVELGATKRAEGALSAFAAPA